jgi:uridylate kinase
MKAPKNTFVLSLGGSVFAPSHLRGVDIQYLKEFEKFLREKISAGMRFFVVTGGGYAARDYRDAATAALNGRAGKISKDDLDWLGIHASRLNAHLFRTVFSDVAYPKILLNFDRIDKQALEYPVVFGAGWKTGWSTDYDAVMIAVDYGIKRVVNMSNIKYVYDKDPNKHDDAQPIKSTTWAEIFKIVGDEWTPGLNMPFDPIASRLAADEGVEVVVCDGKNLPNVDNILEGKDFEGTLIK